MRQVEGEADAAAAVDDAGGHDGDDPSTSTSSGSDSDSGSDDDSDFEEVDASEEDAAALSKLEEEMAAPGSAPPSFESHLQLISLLRRCRMSRRLRQARGAAAAAFPLPESVWIEWLEDERKAAFAAKAKGKKPELSAGLVALHEAAVADFLSVPVWASYLRALRELDGEVSSFSPEGVARFRAVADRALAVAGAHVGKGRVLWREARRFELDLLKESSSSAAAAAVAEAEARARSLWHRQLSTPLLYEAGGEEAEEGEESSSEQVRKELLEWERERDGALASLPAWLVAAADAACSAATARSASEEAVSPPPSSSSASAPTREQLLAAHLAYLRLEERALAAGKGDKKENLKRVLVAHERAVAAFPLTPFLWCSLGSFAEASLAEDPGVATSIYSRALRNCPWVGELWARALRATERRGDSNPSPAPPPPSSSSSSSSAAAAADGFDALFRAAMSAPLSSADDFVECILARLDRLRRRAQQQQQQGGEQQQQGGEQQQQQGGEQQQLQQPLLAELRAAFAEASQWLSAAFPLWEDPGLRLAAYLPQLELALPGGGGPEGAARAWELFAAAAPAAAAAAAAAANPAVAPSLSAEFFVSWARAAVEHGLRPPGAAGGPASLAQGPVALGRAILKRALALDGGAGSRKEKTAKKGGAVGQGAGGAGGAGPAPAVSLPPTKKLSAGPAAAAAVAAAWLRFEREWGSAEEHFAASLRAAPLLEAAAVAAAAAASASGAGAAAVAGPSSRGGARSGAAGPAPGGRPPPKGPQPERTKEELLALRRERDPNFNKSKREKPREDADAPAKRSRTDAGGGGGGGEEAAAAAAAAPAQQQQQQNQRQQSPAAEAAPSIPPRAADDEHRTAFVRGFPASATEAALAEFFAKASAAASASEEGDEVSLPVVRRPKGPDGLPRGFAYVEFGSKEALARAVASADGKRFGGGGGGGGEEGDGGPVLSVAVSRPPAAGGGGRGRGGGGGGGGRGPFGGGRGSFGGGGRGRGGRAGLGFAGFGGGGRGGGGRGVHLDLGGGGPSSAAAAPAAGAAAAGTAAPPPFVPRVVASAAAPAPKSNADFRAMLLGGKK